MTDTVNPDKGKAADVKPELVNNAVAVEKPKHKVKQTERFGVHTDGEHELVEDPNTYTDGEGKVVTGVHRVIPTADDVADEGVGGAELNGNRVGTPVDITKINMNQPRPDLVHHNLQGGFGAHDSLAKKGKAKK